MTILDLETARQDGMAELVVDHANHREFVIGGKRYHCCWCYARKGWAIYRVEAEAELLKEARYFVDSYPGNTVAQLGNGSARKAYDKFSAILDKLA